MSTAKVVPLTTAFAVTKADGGPDSKAQTDVVPFKNVSVATKFLEIPPSARSVIRAEKAAAMFVHKLNKTYGEEELENRLRDKIATENRSSRFLIDPKWNFSRKWDGLMILLLVYTAIFTPFEVAFLETKFNLLFGFNRLVDTLFICDLILNFFFMVEDPESGEIVKDIHRIRALYFRGWFTCDILSVLPFESVSSGLKYISPGTGESLQSLKVLRVVRLLRLIKLLRVVRASRIFARWESSIGLSFSTISVLKFSLSMVLVSHWLACIFHLVPQFDEQPPYKNWLVGAGMWDSGVMSRYIISLYWSVTTVTTVGYGDITPQSDFERFMATIFMVIGGIFYAYVMGSICGIVSSLDRAGTAYKQTMDILNLYMDEVKLPYKDRMALREYFMYCRSMQRSLFYKDVLQQMSPGLQGRFAKHVYGQWLGGVYFLRLKPNLSEKPLHGHGDNFVSRIALFLEPEAFPPQEPIIKKGERTLKMYIIVRGLCARLGRVLTKGRTFGEDVILNSVRRTYDVLTLTMVDVHVLHKESLESILEDFQARKKVVRRAAMHLALSRGIVIIAKNFLALKEKHKLTDTKISILDLDFPEGAMKGIIELKGVPTTRVERSGSMPKKNASGIERVLQAVKENTERLESIAKAHAESTMELRSRLEQIELSLPITS